MRNMFFVSFRKSCVRFIRAAFAVAVALTAVCALSGCGAAGGGPAINRVTFENGERFAGYQVTDGSGETLNIEDTGTDAGARMYYYLSRTCKDCNDEYHNYEFLAGALQGGPVEMIYLWYDNPPGGEGPPLPRDNYYSVAKDLKLAGWTPTYYFTDADGLILFQSIDMGEVAGYLGETIPAPERQALLAAWLERGRVLVYMSNSEPDTAVKTGLDALAGDGAYEKVLTVGPKDAAWADFSDNGGLFAMFSGTADDGVYLYADDGRLVIESTPPRRPA